MVLLRFLFPPSFRQCHSLKSCTRFLCKACGGDRNLHPIVARARDILGHVFGRWDVECDIECVAWCRRCPAVPRGKADSVPEKGKVGNRSVRYGNDCIGPSPVIAHALVRAPANAQFSGKVSASGDPICVISILRYSKPRKNELVDHREQDIFVIDVCGISVSCGCRTPASQRG